MFMGNAAVDKGAVDALQQAGAAAFGGGLLTHAGHDLVDAGLVINQPGIVPRLAAFKAIPRKRGFFYGFI